MWKCKHCETINNTGEVCKVCGYSRPTKSYEKHEAIKESSLISTIKKCAQSNVSIAAIIFFAANILLQLIGVLSIVNSATSIIQNEMVNGIFGISDLSETILSSIVNYSISGIIIANLPTIVICVFGMIYCFYARFSKSELKVNAINGIKIVEIVKAVLDGLSILFVLIYAIMFIPTIPSSAQGPLILFALLVIGFLTLSLIFRIFIIKALSSLVNSIKYNNSVLNVSTFIIVMLYIYGCLFGLGALLLIILSPTLTLALGCECTAYILFAISLNKLKQEVIKTPVSSKIDSSSEAWKRPVDVDYGSRTTPVSGSGVKTINSTRTHRYIPSGGKAPVETIPSSYPSKTASRSSDSFKKAKDFD